MNDSTYDKQPTKKRRLKILFLSQPFLYPLDTGGKIRTAKLLEQLKNIFDITLISNYEASRDKPYLERMTGLCREYHPVPWNPVKKYTPRMFSRYPIIILTDYSKDIEGNDPSSNEQRSIRLADLSFPAAESQFPRRCGKLESEQMSTVLIELSRSNTPSASPP